MFASDLGNSCKTHINSIQIFHQNKIEFVPLEKKSQGDGKFGLIENQGRINSILQTHELIKKKQEKFGFALKGTEQILKQVLEGIHNYEGVL